MKSKLKIDRSSYKIGVDEIKGLKPEMKRVFKPIEDYIRDRAYWMRSDSNLVQDAEYKSRDWFIAHSHNNGGLIIQFVVPKCEEHDFQCLEFGECDGCFLDTDECCREHDGECLQESEGLLDACLRIWFKFEGLDNDTETLRFYLTASGGNGDAPYFRGKYLSDIYESEFECQLTDLESVSKSHIEALLEVLRKGVE